MISTEERDLDQKESTLVYLKDFYNNHCVRLAHNQITLAYQHNRLASIHEENFKMKDLWNFDGASNSHFVMLIALKDTY